MIATAFEILALLLTPLVVAFLIGYACGLGSRLRAQQPTEPKPKAVRSFLKVVRPRTPPG
jgi:hypothetical protein